VTFSGSILVRNSTLVQRFAGFDAKALLDMQIWHGAKTLRPMIAMPRSHKKSAPGNEADKKKYQQDLKFHARIHPNRTERCDSRALSVPLVQ
jgi:hypothetical protein